MESSCNGLSHNQSLVRAVICSGLYPGISSVVVGASLFLSLNVSVFLSLQLEDLIPWRWGFSWFLVVCAAQGELHVLQDHG